MRRLKTSSTIDASSIIHSVYLREKDIYIREKIDRLKLDKRNNKEKNIKANI
jgi:hypothetical protein